MSSGQFVMARCGTSYDPLLRRALSLHHQVRTADGSSTAGFLFGMGKTWADWLSTRRPGDEIDLIGPLGHGFRRDKGARHLLLIANGLGVAPLVSLAEEGVASGANVVLIVDSATKDGLYPTKRLPAEVEIVALTSDGSSGRQGSALDAFAELQPWADQIFLSGGRDLIEGVRSTLKRAVSGQPVQAIIEERMACGIGACLGCVVDTKNGRVASCVEGPVFDLRSLSA